MLIKPTPNYARIVASVALVALGAGMWLQQAWMWWTAFGLLAAVALSEDLTRLIGKGWMLLGQGLGWINSRIVLGLVFVLILTPLALVYRLIKGDFLGLKKKEKGSYYVEREKVFEKKDLEEMW